MHETTPVPDFRTVPAGFSDKVCGCGRRDSFSLQNIPFPWWVCSVCHKPAPLNALNARLIRECEICEEPYFIANYPDKMDCCPDCL